MAIWFDIDAKSGVPIFKQIIEQVKRAIATGMLKPDEQLPTVRELAEEHSVNPNTIAKAYQNLEVMGLVYTRPGVRGGTFIAREVVASVRAVELERFQEEVRKVVRSGYNLGLEQADLHGRFQRELDEWYSNHPLPAPATIDLTHSLAEHNAKKLYSTKE
ncbi:MAG: GntR family transcriptional regulator [Chloroflexota bacterium]|nr:GntR family transcriptional regulator [Chloroflexota bacterium]